jgi:hypothetical protein
MPLAVLAKQAAIIGGAKDEQIKIHAYVPHPEEYTEESEVWVDRSTYQELVACDEPESEGFADWLEKIKPRLHHQ